MSELPVETVHQRTDANVVASTGADESETKSAPADALVYPIELIDVINKIQAVIGENLSRLEEMITVCLRPSPGQEPSEPGNEKEQPRPVLSQKLLILQSQAEGLNAHVEQLIDRVEL